MAVFTLLGQTVTSYASAGTIGDPKCCCPVKAKCKCHDHDGKAPSSATLKRCAGDAKLVTPAHVPAVPAIDFEVRSERRIVSAPPFVSETIPDDVVYEPETPPF